MVSVSFDADGSHYGLGAGLKVWVDGVVKVTAKPPARVDEMAVQPRFHVLCCMHRPHPPTHTRAHTRRAWHVAHDIKQPSSEASRVLFWRGLTRPRPLSRPSSPCSFEAPVRPRPRPCSWAPYLFAVTSSLAAAHGRHRSSHDRDHRS